MDTLTSNTDMESSEANPAPDAWARARALLAALALIFPALVLGFVLGGEPAQLATAGVTVAPFLLLAGLLQLSHVWRRLRGVAWAWFWLLLLGFVLLTLALTFGALAPTADGSGSQDRLLITVGLMAISFLVTVGLVISGRWLQVGQVLGGRLARGNAWHAQAVAGLLFFAVVSFLPLFALNGEAPLLRIIAQDDTLLDAHRSSAGNLLDLFYGLAWTVPFALVGAGFPVRRSLRAGLARLGLLPLTRRDLPPLLAVAVGLVGLAFALDAFTAAVWDLAGWRRTDTGALGRLFESITSPLGAVSVGVTAGLGEELIARGLLQPRLGWVVPNLAFAAAHAFQYGPDGLLSVFIVGGVLALVRARWNTTASALTHGLYDFILILGSALGAF